MILDRKLPFDLDAEAGVIGSVLLLPDCYEDVVSVLSAGDFFDDGHRDYWQAIVNLRESNRAIDATLLVAELKTAGTFETSGGAARLAKTAASVANAANAAYYAQIVRQHAIRRKVIQSTSDVLHAAYDDAVSVESLIGTVDSAAGEASDMLAAGKAEIKPVGELLASAIDELDARTKGNSDRIKTGLCGIDRIIVGLKKKQFAVIGARPSQGKTSLLLRVAYNLATGKSKLNVLFMTLEMSEEELAERLLSMIGKVNSWRMQSGRMTTDDRQSLADAAGRIRNSGLLIADPGTITASQIGARCRSYGRKVKGGIDVLVVDYVQLITEESGTGKESRQQKIGRMTRKLKQIAKDQNLLVVTAAQLNRDTDKSGREPRLSDLREAGDIENDADVVILCHMPGAENDKKRADSPEKGEECKLLVRKNRNGPTGDVRLSFDAQAVRFGNHNGPDPRALLHVNRKPATSRRGFNYSPPDD